jgi:hypothetical protein
VYVCADKAACQVAVHAARGDLQDLYDVPGMLEHHINLGDPDLEQVDAAQFADSFDIAKKGFAIMTGIEALWDAGELPHSFRVLEAGLKLCANSERCAASTPLLQL